MNPTKTYKNNGAVILAIVLALCIIPLASAAPPVLTGVSNRTHAIQSFVNFVPTLLAGQCTTTSVDTYGSFHKCQNNTYSDAIGMGIDFRFQENIYGLAYLYENDPTNTYRNNRTVLKAAIIGGDNLVFGIDDNSSATPSWEWSEYGGWKTGSQGRVATFFAGGEWLRAWKILNSSIEDFCFEEDAADSIPGTGTVGCPIGGINYTVASRYTWVNDTTVLNATYFLINGSNNQQHTHIVSNASGNGTRSWDINDDRIVDGFVNVTFEVWDNDTGTVEIYWTNSTGTYNWHTGDFTKTNTGTWKNFTVQISFKGIYEQSGAYDAGSALEIRKDSTKAYSQFRIQPQTNPLILKRVKVTYFRRSEWTRVATGVCNHIANDYSNPSYDIKTVNQWAGGAYTLMLCNEMLGNSTYNSSALTMLNRTISGDSQSTGEKDGVYKELHGFSGNYNEVTQRVIAKMSNDYPWTQLYTSSAAVNYFELESYLIFGYNVSSKQTSFGTRTAGANSPISWQANNCGALETFFGNVSAVDQRMQALAINNTQIVNITLMGSGHYFTLDGTQCVDTYRYWQTPTPTANRLPQENDSARYLQVWNNSQLFTVKTANYTCWGTYGHDIPRAQLVSCYDVGGNHFFSGKQAQEGMNVMDLYNSQNSSRYDEYSTLTVLSASYPYSIMISGGLKNNLGISKSDSNDGMTNLEYNVTPAVYSTIHKNVPGSAILKKVDLTSDVSTINNGYVLMFGWSNYGNRLNFTVNGNSSCAYAISFDNEWDWSVTQIDPDCLINGENTIETTGFSAGEQIRIATNSTIDLNKSASKTSVGSPYNYSDVSPYSNVVDGEYAIRLGYDSTDSATSFNVTYQFYDSYLTANASISGNVSVNFTSVSKESISSYGVAAGTPRHLNNITLLPLDFAMTVSDGTQAAQMGTLDIYNSSGRSAYYMLYGLYVDNSQSQFLKDNQSRRLSLPIVVANGSSNTKTITSSVPGNVNNVTVTVLTGSIIPSSPRITYPNGSSEYPSYLYDSVGGTMTFNATIEPGANTVYIDSVVVVLENASVSPTSPGSRESVELTVDVGDDTNNVTATYVVISKGDTVLANQSLAVKYNNTYYYIFTGTEVGGTYDVIFYAEDGAGNVASYDAGSFTVTGSGVSSGGGGSGGFKVLSLVPNEEDDGVVVESKSNRTALYIGIGIIVIALFMARRKR